MAEDAIASSTAILIRAAVAVSAAAWLALRWGVWMLLRRFCPDPCPSQPFEAWRQSRIPWRTEERDAEACNGKRSRIRAGRLECEPIVSSSTPAILLGLSAYILSNLGMAVQKQGVPGLPRFKEALADPQVRRWLALWTLGTLMTIGGVGLLFPALAMGKASVIASFGGVGLAALVLFSWAVLKEGIGRTELAGVALIALGTALVGLLGGADPAGNAFHPRWMLGYGGLLMLLALLFSIAATRTGRLTGLALGTASGTLAGLGIMLQKVVGQRAGAATGLGGQLWAGLTDVYFLGWLALTAVAFGVIQLAYLHGKAVTVVPAYTSATMVVPIAGAPVVFGEQLTPGLLAGLALLLVGVVLLGRGAGRAAESRGVDHE